MLLRRSAIGEGLGGEHLTIFADDLDDPIPDPIQAQILAGPDSPARPLNFESDLGHRLPFVGPPMCHGLARQSADIGEQKNLPNVVLDEGDLVILAAALPFNSKSDTNLMKLHRIGAGNLLLSKKMSQ